MKDFEKLPMELIDIILNYNGSIKLRNGVYINQIPRNDTRYELLKQLPTDAVNNMEIMEEIDGLKDYINNDGENNEVDFYRLVLMDIINKYDGLFTRMNGYDHILNIDFDLWFSIENISELWTGFYDYSDEESDELQQQ